MEKDILQGLEPINYYDKKDKKIKKWIDVTNEGQLLKKKICEWSSLRFQALYRTINGFMQVI